MHVSVKITDSQCARIVPSTHALLDPAKTSADGTHVCAYQDHILHTHSVHIPLLRKSMHSLLLVQTLTSTLYNHSYQGKTLPGPPFVTI